MLGNEAKRLLNFSLASDVEDIPDVPGIYAWYTPLKGDDSTDLKEFLRSLQENFERYSPLKRIQIEGRQKTFRVDQTKPSFSDAYVDGLNLTLTPAELQMLSKLVLILSFLSEPFYIGKTDSGLRGRIKDHLGNPDSFQDGDLRNILKNRVHSQAGARVLQQCLVVYVPLESASAGKSMPRLLEHVLIRLVQPSQSVKG